MFDANLQSPEILNPQVVAFINHFESFAWFQNVGKPIQNNNIKQIHSWDNAWESLQDESWTDASFHEQIDQQHPAWIAAYDKVKQIISASENDYELEDGVFASMQAAYDAGGAAYEIAVNKNEGYYQKLIKWYQLGHWPCGWEGTFPKGKLIIF